MMLLALALVTVTPFSDAQSRYNVSLPDGWSFVPLTTGNEDTATFRCQNDKLLANALINVMPAEHGATLHNIAVSSGSVAAKAPGYRLLAQGAAKLGSLDAFRRRYLQTIDDSGKWQKMSEDRWAMVSGRVFVVHVETLAESFAHFETDFDAIFASFLPGALIPVGDDMLVDSPLVGRWIMTGANDTVLDFRADGTFDLAGTHGTYVVEGKILRMRPLANGVEEQFTWRRIKGELVLESPTLGEPITYRSAATPTKKGEKKKAQP